VTGTAAAVSFDRRGAVARITAAKVLRAAALVQTGEVYALSHPLTWPPRESGDPRLRRPPVQREPIEHNSVFPLPDGRFGVVNDDVVRFALQGSSHWDALAHFGVLEPGSNGIFYGDRGLDEVDSTGSAQTLGIDAVAGGVVTRTVIFDMVGFLGRAEQGFLEDETRITADMLLGFLAAHRLELEDGDAALVYTGFYRRWQDNGGVVPETIAGLDGSSMPVWRDSGVAALASDNPTLDAVPMDSSIHIGALRELGVLLGEYWALDELVAACRGDNRYECLLASAPLNLPGAFGSPCNALAVR
jgi:kynurenine formamidase